MALFLFLFQARDAKALVIFVNDGATAGDLRCGAAGSNLNPGTAALPVATLQFALANFVLGVGDSIYVEAGTYTDQMLAVTVADAGVAIKGASRALTIFDGVNRTARWMIVNGNNVKIRSMTVRRYGHPTGLAGQALTLQDATGMVVEDILFEDQGTSGGEASIYIATTNAISTTATVRNCVIQNTIGNFGGGIDICANAPSATPTLNVTITDCLIENCGKNNFNGGALLIYKGLSALTTTPAPIVVANNCVFGAPGRGNLAQRGGGIYVDNGSTLTLNGACVSNNQATDVAGPDGGGGIYIIDGTVNLIDGMVSNNTANTGTGKQGGGIYIHKLFSGTSTLNINQTVISGNQAIDGGGLHLGRSTTTMKNVLMYDNTVTDEGGAIVTNNLNCFLTMHNCTVTENASTSISSSRHGGLQNKSMGLGTIKNCIFWNNTRADMSSPSLITVSFSIVDNGGVVSTFVSGGSNSTADPIFMNAPLDDFRLLNASSPAVNAGTLDGGVAPLGDLVSTTRTGLPDMGAYELGAATTLSRDCPSMRQLILPVHMYGFAMECSVEGSVAQWQADLESSSPDFWVEGSIDGEVFTQLTDIARASQQQQTVDFRVALPPTATPFHYYRLAAQDANGQTVEHSAIVAHSPCERLAMDLRIYPSIVHDQLRFELRSQAEATFSILVTDMAGRQMHEAHFAATAEVADQFSVEDYPAGTYFFRVQDDLGHVDVKRFVKF
jgi:hypothetical protein